MDEDITTESGEFTDREAILTMYIRKPQLPVYSGCSGMKENFGADLVWSVDHLIHLADKKYV